MRRSRRRGLVPSLLVLWIAAAACQLASSGTPLADSDEHAGIFTFTGEEDEYEFTADIGGHVAMRAVRNSGALYPGLELIDPDGGQIDITSDASATGIDHTTVLEAALARDGALGVREAVRLMTQVLEALASAHARGSCTGT